MHPLLTISALARAQACPPSIALPQVRWHNPWTEEGRVVHRYLQRVAEVGAPRALAEVPEEHTEACNVIDLSRLPTVRPDLFLHEVTLAYDTATDTARQVGRGLTRDEMAAQARPGEVLGTLDVLGAGDDRALVVDYKRGWGDTGPLREHAQLRGYATLAARALGFHAATIVRIRLPSDGEPVFHSLDLDELDLDATAYSIRNVHQRAERFLAELGTAKTRGESNAQDWLLEQTLTRGDHCEHCPALPRCPAYITLSSAALLAARTSAAIAPEVLSLTELTPATAPAHLAMADQLELAATWIRGGVEQLSREAPIPLPGGKLYGPHPFVREPIDGAKGAPVLAERYPELVAAVRPTITRTSIKAALQARKAEVPSTRIGRETVAVLGALRAAGALVERVTYPVGEYEPAEAPALPEGEP